MKISFDIDAVILNTDKKMLNIINKKYNKKFTTYDVDNWFWFEKYYPDIFSYFDNPDFYKDIELINGMDVVLDTLIKKYHYSNIQFVTSSDGISKIGKEKRLHKVLSHIDNIKKIKIIHVGLYSNSEQNNHSKYEYTKNTILIDDALHNVEAHIKQNNDYALLVDFGYGWNQNVSSLNKMIRVKNPNEIVTNITNLISK